MQHIIVHFKSRDYAPCYNHSFRLGLIVYLLLESKPSPSNPSSREWILTDEADDTELGTAQRILDKAQKIRQHSNDGT